MNKLILAATLAATALATTAATLASAQMATGTTAPAPPPPPRLSPGARLLAADANHDGIVTREEAIADAARRFAARDTDRDGKVTGEERRAERAPPPPRGDGQARHRRGPGMDRALTQAQARERATRLFDRTDTNHDGRVDQRERDAMDLLIRARMPQRDFDAPPPPPPPAN